MKPGLPVTDVLAMRYLLGLASPRGGVGRLVPSSGLPPGGDPTLWVEEGRDEILSGRVRPREPSQPIWTDNPQVHSDRLRTAFESRDLDQFMALMDENVLWRGLQQPDDETPICRSRAEVREVLVRFLERGGTGYPEILVEVG